MSPTIKLLLLSLFLIYAITRAVVYFRSKRPQFGIAVVFVCCIVIYELVWSVIELTSESG